MLNNVIIVGTLTNDVEIKELESGKKVSEITVMVKKPFINAETNQYDFDHIKVTLWQALAQNVHDLCKKGSTIGIKGRLSTKKYEAQDGRVYNNLEVIAENITCIKSE